MRRPAWMALALSFVLVASSPAASSAEEEYNGPTPPRLSLIEGPVSFWPAGGSDWEAAPPNLPLEPGDVLSTGDGARVELEVGWRSFLRLAAHGSLGFDTLETQLQRFTLNEGRATLDVRGLDPGTRLEFRSPHATLVVTSPGTYDIRVDPERSRFTVYDGSGATVVGPQGSTVVAAGSEVVTGSGFAQPVRYDAPALDDWVRWGRERSDRILAAASRQYVPEGVYGARDLDDHGTWRSVPTYGQVWVPARVPSTWAPYTTGRWVWRDVYGWSWVDTQPWGWAPFHYGRWVWLDSYWGWAPGPVVRPVYAPALVAFLSPPVGVVVGVRPYVSWVALGWGEPVLPWWGPTWYRGRPCWRGWGGPTYINEVHVHVDRRRSIRHDHFKIDRYRNQRFRDAVVSVDRRQFDHRSPKWMRWNDQEQQRFRPVRDAGPPPGRRVERRDGSHREGPQRPAPERAWRRSGAPSDRPQGDVVRREPRSGFERRGDGSEIRRDGSPRNRGDRANLQPGAHEDRRRWSVRPSDPRRDGAQSSVAPRSGEGGTRVRPNEPARRVGPAGERRERQPETRSAERRMRPDRTDPAPRIPGRERIAPSERRGTAADQMARPRAGRDSGAPRAERVPGVRSQERMGHPSTRPHSESRLQAPRAEPRSTAREPRQMREPMQMRQPRPHGAAPAIQPRGGAERMRQPSARPQSEPGLRAPRGEARAAMREPMQMRQPRPQGAAPSVQPRGGSEMRAGRGQAEMARPQFRSGGTANAQPRVPHMGRDSSRERRP